MCGQETCAANISDNHPWQYNGRSKTALEDHNQLLYIPVVVHIVYSSEAENISDQQVYSQLTVLNEDYNRQNADTTETLEIFRDVAADCRIKFFLANKDETDNPINPITRRHTEHGLFFNDDIHYTAKGGIDALNTKKYLNIWICDLPDGTFGYASSPGTNAETDGVVIDYRYFGTIGTVSAPYDKGRTLTHEVGHWLGLIHPWGFSGGCSEDDGIDDTPIQSGPITGCVLDTQSCGSLNMVQNYMNLSYDGCMNLFTTGQKAVMRSVLFSERSELLRENVITNAELSPSYKQKIEIATSGNKAIWIRDIFPDDEIRIFDSLGRPVAYSKRRDEETLIHVADGHGMLIVIIRTKSELIVKKIIIND